MEQIVLKSRQLLNVDPVQSHPRLSLQRVIWVRILRWVDKASSYQLKKAIFRLSWTVLLALLIFQSQFLLGLFLGAMQWHGARIPLFLALLGVTLYAKPAYLYWKRQRMKIRGMNQHMFCGMPVGELASFLKEHNAFKYDDVTSKLGLSRNQYDKAAETMEKYDLLYRGESNARFLQDISLQNLVMQLRALAENKAPPLAWSEERTCWYERNGTFDQWAISKDFERRKVSDAIEKEERKLKRVRKQVADLSPTLLMA